MKPPSSPARPSKNLVLHDLVHDVPFLRQRGVGPQVAEAWGVGICREDPEGRMSGRIVFPVRQACGRLLGYAGLDPDQPASESDPTPWILSANLALGQELFGIERVHSDRRVAQLALRDGLTIVENPLEVVRAVQQMRLAVVSPIMPRDLNRVRILRRMQW